MKLPLKIIENTTCNKKVLFISFDAVPVSGITVESTKLAKYLNAHGFSSFIDLGYDIKVDKGNFGRDYTRLEKDLFYRNFQLIRNVEIKNLASYTPDFIERVNNTLINGTLNPSKEERDAVYRDTMSVASQIAEILVEKWEKININYLIIENGTLPDNIVYTHALYKAIEKYGKKHKLGYYVLWRDHDLMWNSERLSNKYGEAPWPYAVKPIDSPYIQYVTLNKSLASKLKEWCGNTVDITVLRNTYPFDETQKTKDLRSFLGISKKEFFIARTTRLIPEKRLDRDLHLIKRLNEIRTHEEDKVHLVIAGDRKENPEYTQQLEHYIKEHKIEQYVHFMGILSHNFIESNADKFTIQDLYNTCDLVSFLTSYDYDSYGNPIGEAISHKKCYLSTSYEFYQDVYGQYGFQGVVMPISATHDSLPEEEFIHSVWHLLIDHEKRKAIAEENYTIGQRLLSNTILQTVFKI